MTVTFCGHKSIPNDASIKIFLYKQIQHLIKNGATKFLLGGYGDFDFLAASVVKELKGIYPHITSILVIPYLNKDYNLNLYDTTLYPPIEKVPLRFAISKRNEYMVDKADIVIAYVKHSFGGAAQTLNYAKRRKKEIIMINPF